MFLPDKLLGNTALPCRCPLYVPCFTKERGVAARGSMVIPCRIESPSLLLPQGLCSTGDAANRRRAAGFACRNAPPIFSLQQQKADLEEKYQNLLAQQKEAQSLADKLKGQQEQQSKTTQDKSAAGKVIDKITGDAGKQ